MMMIVFLPIVSRATSLGYIKGGHQMNVLFLQCYLVESNQRAQIHYYINHLARNATRILEASTNSVSPKICSGFRDG
jgi:hypothetical protein